MLATLAIAAAAAGSVGSVVPPTSDPPPIEVPTSEPGTPLGGTGASVSRQLPAGYHWVVDDTVSIVVAVPDSWSDSDVAPTQLAGFPDDEIADLDVPYLAASPDRQAFLTGFDTPGVRFVALPYVTIDPAAVAELYHLDTDACAEVTDEPYVDPVFIGTQFTGTGCGTSDGDGGATWHLIVAAPDEQDFVVIIDVQLVEPDDDAAFDMILNTFNLTDVAVPPTPTTAASEPPATTEP